MHTSPDQMVALLRFVKGAYTSFEVREATAESWLVVLGTLEYQDVFRAVHELVSSSGQWAPSPGDVAERVKSYTPRVGASDVLMIEGGSDPADETDLLRMAREGHELTYWERVRLFKFIVPVRIRASRFPEDRAEQDRDREEWARVSRNYGDLWDREILTGGSSMKSAPHTTFVSGEVPL